MSQIAMHIPSPSTHEVVCIFESGTAESLNSNMEVCENILSHFSVETNKGLGGFST